MLIVVPAKLTNSSYSNDSKLFKLCWDCLGLQGQERAGLESESAAWFRNRMNVKVWRQRACWLVAWYAGFLYHHHTLHNIRDFTLFFVYHAIKGCFFIFWCCDMSCCSHKMSSHNLQATLHQQCHSYVTCRPLFRSLFFIPEHATHHGCLYSFNTL